MCRSWSRGNARLKVISINQKGPGNEKINIFFVTFFNVSDTTSRPKLLLSHLLSKISFDPRLADIYTAEHTSLFYFLFYLYTYKFYGVFYGRLRWTVENICIIFHGYYRIIIFNSWVFSMAMENFIYCLIKYTNKPVTNKNPLRSRELLVKGWVHPPLNKYRQSNVNITEQASPTFMLP